MLFFPLRTVANESDMLQIGDMTTGLFVPSSVTPRQQTFQDFLAVHRYPDSPDLPIDALELVFNQYLQLTNRQRHLPESEVTAAFEYWLRFLWTSSGRMSWQDILDLHPCFFLPLWGAWSF